MGNSLLGVWLAFLATALALQLPSGAPTTTRRSLMAGTAFTAAAGGILPATALDPLSATVLDIKLVNPLDRKTFSGPRGLLPQSDIVMPKGQGVVNTGVLLLREAFDGEAPSEGRLSWLEAHLAPDFEASLAGGTVKQNKEVCRRIHVQNTHVFANTH